MCLLDNTSGAAISVRSFLEALAGAGIECEAFTASHFDPNREINLTRILGPKVRDPGARWKRFIIDKNGVRHSVFLTENTQSAKTSHEELQAFARSWRNWLERNKPKMVVTFGGTGYSVKMQDLARARGSQIVFYLGNAEYDNADFYTAGDQVICPSEFLRDHYRETLGLEATVVRTIMQRDRLDEVSPATPEGLLRRKNKGFVTFMNPIPHKGLTLFARIAQLAFREKPDLKFLVTEGRTNRDWLARHGLDITQFPNVWFIPNHDDVRSIYERTSILLVPSFWQEGFSRSVLEAQLSGIPVIASRRGGTAEALNGGGVSLDIPQACAEDFMARPDDETVSQWWQEIAALADDDAAYVEAAQRALSAARPFHPEVTTDKAVEFFAKLLESPGRD